MYKDFEKDLTNSQLEEKILEFWEKNNIEKKSIETKPENKRFVFYEGPPTANGRPGIHHIAARSMKDWVCRYKTMKGYRVERKAGWDTHGLPVEIEVEKQLGIKSKEEIEAYGVEAFNKKCKESVFTYEKEWRNMTRRIGYWLDMDNPYITLDNNYIESVWWLLYQFWKAGMIYLGHKILPYCPRCGTPLSSHEVSQGYKEVSDPSIYVKFKVLNEENTFFLVWTTTPWTLISNVALAVNPESTYVKLKYKDEFIYMAESRVAAVYGKEEFEILEKFKGSELVGKEYEQMFKYIKVDKKAFFVVPADFVTMEDGSGIVHIAPAFGQDDNLIGKKYDLPVLQPVDGSGKFTAEITDWANKWVKDADPSIINYLKINNILVKQEKIKHSYPFCWRCDSPLLYYARKSWYIKTSEYKEKMIINNNTIKWYPKFVGEGRFGEWLENNIDWSLSRDRYWGTPLNIWICENCGKEQGIESIEMLKKLGKNVPDDIELHKPYVDNIELTCPHCNGVMKRTPEVIDCWFDSGAMPYAQLHYPFENKENFDKYFPADFIAEGIDQTRGWFYSLLAISTFISGKSSYKSVLVNELILSSKGEKMSKSKGNTVDPWSILSNQGSDALRWYLYTVSPPWVPTKFDVAGVDEVNRKFIGTLKNIYSFFVLYANIDKFDPRKYKFSEIKFDELDRWIISKLNSLINKVNEWNEIYEVTKTTRALQDFIIDDVSNWYVRRSRRRFWRFELNEDKIAAYTTLYYVLINSCKLLAPFVPFISEAIYTNLLGEKESVHLDDYPVADNSLIDFDLERKMEIVQQIVYLGRAARNKVQIKIRQPLSTALVPSKYKEFIDLMKELIMEELNVKEIKYTDDLDNYVNYELKLNYNVAGPKFGKLVGKLNETLSQIDPLLVVRDLRNDKEFRININDEELRLVEEDLKIVYNDKGNYVSESNNDYFAILCTELTEELIMEGYCREIINKIQFMRKENNFDVLDRIKVFYFTEHPAIDKVFEMFKDYIQNETLTNEFIKLENNEGCTEWDINDKNIFLKLEKI